MPGGREGDNSIGWVMQARSRLALRRAEKPATKAGQIRALWPDIEAALTLGQSMKTICAWLAEDAGIRLGVTSLTSYVSRIRRREAASRRMLTRPASASNSEPPVAPIVRTQPTISHSQPPLTSSEPGPVAPSDPLANLRASEAKRPGFNYRPPTSADEKDLI